MKIALNPNEMVVKAGDSSYMANGDSIRGKLILTTQRIYFKPEPNGVEHSDLEIQPGEIKDVMFFNEKILFPCGLNIVTKNGQQNKFLVKKRNSWSEIIVKMF
jgi:hypothetical protein